MFHCKLSFIMIVCIASILCSRDGEVKSEEDLGVKYANRCEVCKILATELQSRLEETGKVRDVIEIGYSLDDIQPKKKTKYQKSELRLIESLEGVCDKILEYNIHKERQDSTRFAKGMSQTFKTLHGLVDKGVKVDLGIPYELWDKPSAEITHMKTQCESLLEDNEDAIEYWYWNLQGTKDLKLHLCSDHALKNTDNSCLFENHNVKGDLGVNHKPEKIKVSDKSSASGMEEEEKLDLEETEAAINMEEEQKSKEEIEKFNKEKFVKLYEAGLLDPDDPDIVIDYVELRRRRGEKAVTIDPATKNRLRQQYIKEGLLKERPQNKEDLSGINENADIWGDPIEEDIQNYLSEEEKQKMINKPEQAVPTTIEQEFIPSKEKLRAEQEELRSEQEEFRAEQKELRSGQEELRAEREKLRAEQEQLKADQEELRSEQEELRSKQEELRSEKETLRSEQDEL